MANTYLACVVRFARLARFAPLTVIVCAALSPAAHAANDTGLEIALRPGYGSAGSGSPIVYSPSGVAVLSTPPGPIYGNTATPYGGGFVGQAQLGFRPIRWVSFGLTGGIRTSSASSVNGLSDLSRGAFNAGPYVHAYLPTFLDFEPYLGVGVEYMHDSQTYTQPLAGIPVNFDLVHYGVAIPFTLGIDYRFLDLFAVGPSFQFAEVAAADGCAGGSAGGVSNNFCSGDSNPITAAKSYGVWSLGLDLRATLF